MADLPLSGMRILLMEDEALIAMDVEQLCRDSGAQEVLVVRSHAQIAESPLIFDGVHAAIVDVMLGGTPTTAFARELAARYIPFVFATGYTDNKQLFTEFPGIAVVGKPYAGTELIQAVAEAARSGRRV